MGILALLWSRRLLLLLVEGGLLGRLRLILLLLLFGTSIFVVPLMHLLLLSERVHETLGRVVFFLHLLLIRKQLRLNFLPGLLPLLYHVFQHAYATFRLVLLVERHSIAIPHLLDFCVTLWRSCLRPVYGQMVIEFANMLDDLGLDVGSLALGLARVLGRWHRVLARLLRLLL